MRKRIEKIIILALIVVNLAGVHLYITFYTPASRNASPTVVSIPRGLSFRVIANNLEDAGVIRSADSFIFAAGLLGANKKIKAGEYELSGAMSPMEILNLLVKGEVKRYFVTVPEGYSARDIARLLAGAGLADEQTFLSRAGDAGVAASLGVDGPTLEGYLFPDTYQFTRGMGVDEIIGRMVAKFKSVYFPDIDEAAQKKNMSMRKVVTLASMIEKETGAHNERRRISAVFHNRLKKRIRLQSDPTVIYGIKDFDGNITRRHLLAKNPYNTYANYGLPPGPIANPGRASLEAAIDPENAGFLFFVSKNDGTHYFSESLKEHNAAVAQFQKSVTPAERQEKDKPVF